jgi:sporulation protein YlmC with PRC-barrel domain
MKELVRGTDLVGMPIVTLAGDDVAEVRDVLYDADAGHIVGFSLNKRGRMKGRLKEVLTREQVLAVGPAAVMIDPATIITAAPVTPTGKGGNVLADRVITDAGVAVGTVTDVVVDTGDGTVVGYEVEPADDAGQRKGRRSYIPLPEAIAVSGEALVVPASAVDYVASDLAGFADSVERYRQVLRGGS